MTRSPVSQDCLIAGMIAAHIAFVVVGSPDREHPPSTTTPHTRAHFLLCQPEILLSVLSAALEYLLIASLLAFVPTSKLSGWYSRVQNYATPNTFIPLREDLVFGVRTNSLMAPNGMVLALFSSEMGIDLTGRVLRLQPADFAGLSALAQQILDLPREGPSYTNWDIHTQYTCQSSEHIYIPNSQGSLIRTTVSALNGIKPRKLVHPIGGLTELPAVLAEFLELVLETAQGYYTNE